MNINKKIETEQKLKLVCGKNHWQIDDINGYIPTITFSDGPLGVRKPYVLDGYGDGTAYPSIAYPSFQILANTWNLDLAERMGEALATDCVEKNIDILLAPGVNIKKHPLNGRNFEYFSEDPLLSGLFGYKYILGLQNNGVGACLKHFCANNLEYNRLQQSSEVDEITLKEIYYKPFKIACKAQPISIMCSYNKINSVYASENKIGFDYLRKECGFKGFIVSDWEAVRDRTKSLNAGLDLEMPFNKDSYEKLLKDYEEGKVNEESLNNSVNNILSAVENLQNLKSKHKNISLTQRLATAYDIACEGMVLLKNNNILPIINGSRISLFGCFAKATSNMLSGGGAAEVTWLDKQFNLEKLLTERGGYTVNYNQTFSLINSQNMLNVFETAEANDVSVICVGTGDKIEYESNDRETLKLPKIQERAIKAISKKSKKTVVIVFAGSPIDMSKWIDCVDAVIYSGFCGQEGGEALVDILSGVVNPSGKTSETFPISDEDIKYLEEQIDVDKTFYKDGILVGYRYYQTNQIKCMFPFGYGLSYSAFRYYNLRMIILNNEINLFFNVENQSNYDGKEIVQVYIKPIVCATLPHIKQLKKFQKKSISAHNSEIFNLILNIEDFIYYNSDTRSWKTEDGVYAVEIGSNCEFVNLSAKILLQNEKFEQIKE